MKTKEEVLEYLRGPAILRARDTVKDIQPWILKKGTLTIAQGTYLTSGIRRYNNHITLKDCAGNMALKQPQTKGVSRFDATIRTSQRRALRKVLNGLSVLLEIQPDQDGNPLYHDPEVQEAAQQAASTAQPTTTPYKMEDPGKAGYQNLHNFLGQERVERTLHIFGEHATLNHFKTYTDHQEILEQSAELHPNAVLLWGTLHAREHNTRDTTTDTIINAAHKQFFTHCIYRGITNTSEKEQNAREDGDPPDSVQVFQSTFVFQRTTEGYEEVENHPITNPEQQRTNNLLWNIFLNLPTEALKRVRLDDPNFYYIHLCKRVLEAGTIPSYEATLTLLENPYILYSAMPRLTHSFIRQYSVEDSANSNQQTTEELRLLHALVQTGKKKLRKTETTNNITHLLDGNSTTPAPTWANLMEAATQDMKDLRTHKGKRKPSTPKPKGKSSNMMDARFLLQTPPGDDIVLMATEQPTWDTDPGHRLTLFTDNPETPLLIIEKMEQGTILTHSATPLSNEPLLPVPPREERKPQPHIIHRNNLRYLLEQDQNEIMATSALQHVISDWQHIQPHPDIYRPNINQIAWAVNSYINSPDNGYRYSQDPMGITKTITNALATMTEPHTLAATAEHVNSVTTYHYNAFLTLGNDIQQLCRTNPGAVSWAMNHAQSSEPLNHPGQLITLAKTSLADAGMEPRNWKFIAKLEHPIIRDTPSGYASRLIILLNAMATSGTVLPPDTPNVLMNTIITSAHRRRIHTDRNQNNADQLITANLTTMLTLLCHQDSIREPQHPGFSNVMDQAMDILDYVVDLIQNGEPLRSTTWTGLSKASHHWHRNIRQEQILEEWMHILTSRRRKTSSWESLIGTTTKGEFQIVPLLNQYQLFQESKDMNHCVVGYAYQCANGDRIFSVQRNGIKVATSQIRQMDQGWQEMQTRGRDNHPVSENIRRVMQEIAKDYEDAHRAEEQRLREEGILPEPKNKGRRKTPIRQ